VVGADKAGVSAAAKEAKESDMGRSGDVMLVRLAGASYAVPVAAVREIVRLPAVTRVPGLPAFVAGLANVRGRVLAVIDLRPLLRLDGPRGGRLVILDGAGQGAVSTSGRAIVGLIVDAALNLVELPSSGLEPLPPGVHAEASAVLDGMTVIDGSPVAVLSPAGLLGLRARLAGAA
jgi:purine-binding chemotaxis protein CheW